MRFEYILTPREPLTAHIDTGKRATSPKSSHHNLVTMCGKKRSGNSAELFERWTALRGGVKHWYPDAKLCEGCSAALSRCTPETK